MLVAGAIASFLWFLVIVVAALIIVGFFIGRH